MDTREMNNKEVAKETEYKERLGFISELRKEALRSRGKGSNLTCTFVNKNADVEPGAKAFLKDLRKDSSRHIIDKIASEAIGYKAIENKHTDLLKAIREFQDQKYEDSESTGRERVEQITELIARKEEGANNSLQEIINKAFDEYNSKMALLRSFRK